MVVRMNLSQFRKQVDTHMLRISEQNGYHHDIAQAFVVISNRVVLASEITDDYIERSTNAKFSLDKGQLSQYLKYIYRDLLFIGIMSTIEYHCINVNTGIKIPIITGIKFPHLRKENTISCDLIPVIGGLEEDDYFGRISTYSRLDVSGGVAKGNSPPNRTGPENYSQVS